MYSDRRRQITPFSTIGHNLKNWRLKNIYIAPQNFYFASNVNWILLLTECLLYALYRHGHFCEFYITEQKKTKSYFQIFKTYR